MKIAGSGAVSGPRSESVSQRYRSGSVQKCHGSATQLKTLQVLKSCNQELLPDHLITSVPVPVLRIRIWIRRIHVFCPPGSAAGSISQRYGCGSLFHQAKIVRKTLIPTVNVNVPSKVISKKTYRMDPDPIRGSASGSVPKLHGSATLTRTVRKCSVSIPCRNRPATPHRTVTYRTVPYRTFQAK
jgi:hypothetical protein